MATLFRNVSVTIWQKLLLAMGITLAAFYLLLMFITQSIVAQGFNELERQNFEQYIQRAEHELRDNFELLASVNRDWDVWETSYWTLHHATQVGEPQQSILSGGERTILGLDSLEQFAQDALNNLQIDFIVFMRMDGIALYYCGVDANGEFTTQLPAEIFDVLSPLLVVERLPLYHAPNTPILGVLDPEGNTLGGFLDTPQHLLALSAHYMPISSLATDQQTTPEFSGVVIFGDLMTYDNGQLLSKSLQTHIRFYTLNAPNNATVSEDFSQHLTNMSAEYPNFVMNQITHHQTVGYTLLSNIFGEPTILMEVEMGRTIYQQGQTTVLLLVLFMTVAGIILGGVMFIVIQRLLVQRITNLNQEVNAIDTGQPSSQSITIPNEQDELSQLAHNIQHMVQRLNATQAELTEKNAALADALNQAQQVSRLKSEFLMMMSHELRSPLNIIMGYTGVLKEGMAGKLEPSVREVVEIVYVNSNHLLKLINALLDLSRLETGRLELVEEDINLREIFRKVTHEFQPIADEKKLGFVVEIDPNVPQCLRGDATRIQQIISHLVSNALKFTAKGNVQVQAGFSADGLYLRVKDTGIGIPPHALDLIFEEFRQVDGSIKRAYEGAGMGLAITHRLIATMRGKITVESSVGVGSTFAVLLPLKAVEQSPKTAVER